MKKSWIAIVLAGILALQPPVGVLGASDGDGQSAEEPIVLQPDETEEDSGDSQDGGDASSEEESAADETSDETEDTSDESDETEETAETTAPEAPAEESEDVVILDNIYLEATSLGGLTTSEALEQVEERMDEITGYQIYLHMQDETVAVSAAELGVTGKNQHTIYLASKIGQAGSVLKRYKAQKDLEREPLRLSLQYQVKEYKVREAIDAYCIPLNREKVDYGLTHNGDSFDITVGQTGMTLKTEEAVTTIMTYLTETWHDGPGNIYLPVQVEEPRGSREELALVKDVLGAGDTDYSSSSAERKANIKNATQMISGVLLYPGDTFDFTSYVVPFTEENGYYLAPSYENGETVETYGGGICQVSTTLYLAVLRAELEVTERHNHSMIVSYVNPSMDAAISEGAKNFVFVNSLDSPIYIEGYASGSMLSFVIYGHETRSADRTVTFTSETLETEEATTELTADPEADYGTVTQTQWAHEGAKAVLYKDVTENGVTTREQVNSSTYYMSPNKYTVGVKTSDPEAYSAMYTAIANNDLETVYELRQQY